MGKDFFVTFWMLTLDSIYFPTKLYADKIEELKVSVHRYRKQLSRTCPVKGIKIRENWKKQKLCTKGLPKSRSSKGKK